MNKKESKYSGKNKKTENYKDNSKKIKKKEEERRKEVAGWWWLWVRSPWGALGCSFGARSQFGS